MVGEPGGAAALHGEQDALAFLGQLESHTTFVGKLAPGDKAGGLQTSDVLGHPGLRHPLALGERADADQRLGLDLVEERDLAAGDAQRVELAAQLAVQLEQDRPQPVGDGDGICGEAVGISLT